MIDRRDSFSSLVECRARDSDSAICATRMRVRGIPQCLGNDSAGLATEHGANRFRVERRCASPQRFSFRVRFQTISSR